MGVAVGAGLAGAGVGVAVAAGFVCVLRGRSWSLFADTLGPKTSADSIKPQTARIPVRLRFCSLNNSLKTPQTAQGWGKQRRR